MYDESGAYQDDEPDMEATYVLEAFKGEPGFDQMYQQAEDWLTQPGGMLETFKIYPVNIGTGDDKRALYLARFEMGQAGQDLQFSEAVLPQAQAKGTVIGWVDFMVAFPIACMELQALVGEISSRPDVQQQLVEAAAQDSNAMSPPFPKTLFGGFVDDKILLNLLYLTNDYTEFMAKDLAGEPKPTGLKWWLRYNFVLVDEGQGQKWPYPGEFVALAVRLMPDRFTFSQESSPFLYSGAFLDTVYLTSGYIKEINEPTDDTPYPTYTVTWRKDPNDSGGTAEIQKVRSSDFTTYQVGDRVAILKDVETTKKTQLWKDDDMTALDVAKVAIAPLMFYGIDPDKKE